MCEHKNTAVQESRPPDYIRPDGNPAYAKMEYPCIVVRRRYCSECGERFNTVEIPKDYMDAASDPGAIRREVLGQIQDYLLAANATSESGDKA